MVATKIFWVILIGFGTVFSVIQVNRINTEKTAVHRERLLQEEADRNYFLAKGLCGRDNQSKYLVHKVAPGTPTSKMMLVELRKIHNDGPGSINTYFVRGTHKYFTEYEKLKVGDEIVFLNVGWADKEDNYGEYVLGYLSPNTAETRKLWNQGWGGGY
ncbi:MAG: hypothetical protein AAB821_00420 [Patescibacteria group bacterium]